MAERGKGDHGRRLSERDLAELDRLIAAGETQEAVAVAIGCDVRTVIRWVVRNGGLRRYERRRSPLRLSRTEREVIAVGITSGESGAVIARRLGRSVSTVNREVARNGGRAAYRSGPADEAALDRARRPKIAKLAACDRLRREVEARLVMRWSPEQIAARLKVDFPDDPVMRISHEAIYQALYVGSRRALRQGLSKRLRTKRGHRRARGHRQGGPLRDMVSIRHRPVEANDRAVPGHWEGDLIIGKAGRSAVATIVERQSRYLLLVALPGGRSAQSLREALGHALPALPKHLRRSLTWDQGKEMADHAGVTADTGVPVYFCNPSSPWQRRTNENTNGLLRQYFPKGTDLAVLSQADLDEVATELNGRPRRVLEWMTPSERFNRIEAMTA